VKPDKSIARSVAPRFRRVLLKLSGEVLQGPGNGGIDPATVDRIAAEVATVRGKGVQVGMVIGGGNFFRGISTLGRTFDRPTADQVGMLATVMNALIFSDALKRQGCPAVVMSAIEMPRVAETFVRATADRYLTEGVVVIFCAGTGHPYFSTDTGAALRALETNCDVMMKATKVDGVYSADPAHNVDAVRYDKLSFREVLDRGLGVIDMAAATLCGENGLPLLVFSILEPGNLARAVVDDTVGTIVS
jgi:uridylate kinase